ncbi:MULTISPECIES: L,D-transpeptidase [Marinobacter]|uniref:L,D-transpeptidase n=1 Tax=Marinobacter suaedae TaxID=3057675 RepID=A0ABT8VW50_9GAMM|nr:MULTISPECIES: L,D-transpeptidase [unclassified Marinobacter]MBZ2168317.1 L,D-transpeptidase [Marinobacter sp. F4216]MDO3720213.1 L,D-transpeptidase [Marinobacter sp. chi1]
MSDTSIPLQINISIARQSLTLTGPDGGVVAEYPVSTGLNGVGEQDGSGRTPQGEHYVRAMIGADQPLGTVFRGRRPTGEIYSDELASNHPERDWILSRILWLCGLESGRNRGAGVDTFRRFIYIHGTPDTEPMGIPMSHGCVRMRNADVIDLFERVEAGTPVIIQ